MKQLTQKERSEVIERYCDCMVEIKLRMEVVTGFLLGTVSAKYLPPNVESVCLQFRKILELIALGSLVAHKEDYSRQRANFAQDWHASKILKANRKTQPGILPGAHKAGTRSVWKKGSQSGRRPRPVFDTRRLRKLVRYLLQLATRGVDPVSWTVAEWG